MRKMKKGMAVALIAAMAVGSSMTALAEEPTSGSSTGQGESEGHLETHVIHVVLPTIENGATPFKYKVDTERLIQETNGEKYENATFPQSNDTGVYFLTGGSAATTTYTKKETAPTEYQGGDFDDLPASPDAVAYEALNEDQKTCYDVQTTPATVTYANESEALQVESQSSDKIKLTVEVQATSAATDIKLVNAKPGEDVAEPQLYLGLKVGAEAVVPIEAGKKVSKEVEIAGVPGNFDKKVVTGEDGTKSYAYSPKENATWNSTTFSIEGAASKASAKDLTAPTLTVTWKYTDPAATPVTPVDTYVMTENNGAISYTFAQKPTGTAITALEVNDRDRMGAVTAGNATYNAESGVFTVNSTAAAATGLADGGTVKITIGETPYTLTYTK